jgi:hypothetical protein
LCCSAGACAGPVGQRGNAGVKARLPGVVRHDLQHRLTVGEVPVEKAERPGDQGEMHGQPEESQAVPVEAGLAEEAVVLAEP